jgi:NAD dependent epimerase/dehydratase family enzyme
MLVLVAGAGGLIGSAVALELADHGHDVVRLVRREPGPGEVRWDPDAGTIDPEGLEGFEAVIDVASMPWPTRWTSAAKQRIYDNRVRSYGLLAEALAGRVDRPQVLVCASGMGIYPSSGDELLTEDSAVGTDWLAHLQRDGEAAMDPASAAGIGSCLRIEVLGGPNLAAMARTSDHSGTVASGGLGGPRWSRSSSTCSPPTLGGTVNASPNPVRMGVTRCSARLDRRPAGACRRSSCGSCLADGRRALLASRRMEPRLLEAGHIRFRVGGGPPPPAAHTNDGARKIADSTSRAGGEQASALTAAGAPA